MDTTKGFDIVPPATVRCAHQSRDGLCWTIMTAARSSASQSGATHLAECSGFPWGVLCPRALANGNRYFSKMRSARHVGERLLYLIKRKGPVDHRLHAVGCDRIHHRLKIFN